MLKFQKNIVSAAVAVVAFWLCAFSVAHAWGMLSGDQSQLLDYQNVLSKEPKEALTTFVMMGFRLVGLFLGIGALLILASLFLRREFRQIQDAVLLKWALLSFVIAGTIYGGLMRIVSNQQGAALLFFFSMLLYLVLYSLVGQRTKTNGLFNSIVLLPLYAILLYTMGMPGWAKIFGGDQVINRYVNMFSQSFIADLPGGTALMIYILGILELAVPAFLTISLASGEFKLYADKIWFNYALLLSIFTFGMLCFGLAVLLNFAGSTNLVFYPIFTLLILVSLNKTIKRNKRYSDEA